MNFDTGGQKVVQRLLEAYGYKTRQALCDRLGVSKSTMASRYARDIFPADWVIQASIETGANVKWLTFGEGEKFSNENKKIIQIPTLFLVEGKPVTHQPIFFDKLLLPEITDHLKVVFSSDLTALIDTHHNGLIDGKWLVEMDGIHDFREITRLPMVRYRVSNDISSFECEAKDINLLGKIIMDLSEV